MFRPFQILDRYCYLEFIVMLMVGTALPAGLLFFTQEIKKLTRYMVDFGCPLDLFILMTTMQLPNIIVHCLPAGVLIGIVMVLYRMMADNEIAGLLVCGVSQLRILQPFLIIGCCTALFSLAVNETVVPQTLKTSAKLALLAAKTHDLPESYGLHDFTGVKKDKQTGAVSEVYLVGRRIGNDLINAILLDFKTPGQLKLLYARRGKFKGEAWYLYDGNEYDLSKDEKKVIRNIHFSKMLINPPDFSRLDPDKREATASEMNTIELWKKISSLEEAGKKVDPEYIMSMHYNLSSPMTCLFFVIASFPIALIGRRRQKTAICLAYSGILIVAYFTLEQLTWSLGFNQIIHPVIAIWSPGLAIVTVGGVLYYYLVHHR